MLACDGRQFPTTALNYTTPITRGGVQTRFLFFIFHVVLLKMRQLNGPRADLTRTIPASALISMISMSSTLGRPAPPCPRWRGKISSSGRSFFLRPLGDARAPFLRRTLRDKFVPLREGNVGCQGAPTISARGALQNGYDSSSVSFPCDRAFQCAAASASTPSKAHPRKRIRGRESPTAAASASFFCMPWEESASWVFGAVASCRSRAALRSAVRVWICTARTMRPTKFRYSARSRRSTKQPNSFGHDFPNLALDVYGGGGK